MSRADKLSERIDAIEAMLNELNEMTVNDKKVTKKSRNITDKGILQKAKLMFYQDNKNIDNVKTMLKKKYSSENVSVSFKDWRKVKVCTDELFDGLSQSKKDEYVKKATP
jgi:hypothetical protein